MDGLTTSKYAALLNAAEELGDIEEVLQYIKQLAALKVVLESVDRFHESAIMYAKLEATALVRAIELGGAKRLKGDQRKAAEWLYSLSEPERDKFIEMCGDGLTIGAIYKREVKDPKKFAESIDLLDTLREGIIEELTTDGLTNISWFADEAKSTLSDKPKLANDIVDGLRRAIRQAGGVGIGDKGIYVVPGKVPQEEIVKAIKLRYESIVSDIESIREICQKSEAKVSYKDFQSSFGFQHINGTEAYIPHLLIALDRIGVISDSEELAEALQMNDVKEEIRDTAKFLNMARIKVLEELYEHRYEAYKDYNPDEST